MSKPDQFESSSFLNEGRSIEYEEVSNRGKTSAENPKVER